MTQEKAGFFGSKYVRMLLVIIMALLLFGGPYIVYVLYSVLEMRFVISGVVGGASVVLGLVLMWYLIKKKIIS